MQGSALSEIPSTLHALKGRGRGEKHPAAADRTSAVLLHEWSPKPPRRARKLHKQLFESAHEAGRGPMSPGGCVSAFYCKLPAQPQSHGQQHSIREEPLATPVPPPSHLLGACVLGQSPHSRLPFRNPGSHSWMGQGGVGSAVPPSLVCPPHTPLESTSQAGRNHQRGPPPMEALN